MIILGGLGNPGSHYVNNRHNLGFHVIDCIARQWGFHRWKSRFDALVSEGRIGSDAPGAGQKIMLLKPMTFYNESGRAFAAAANWYRLDPSDIVFFHDDIDLGRGRVRSRQGGHHAGNRGVRSVHQHLGLRVRRVRLGIGHPGAPEKVNPHVMSDFAKAEMPWHQNLLGAILQALPGLIAGDDARFASDVVRLCPAPQDQGDL